MVTALNGGSQGQTMACCGWPVGETPLSKQWRCTGALALRHVLSGAHNNTKQQKNSPTNEAARSLDILNHVRAQRRCATGKSDLVWGQAAKTRNQTTRSTSHCRLLSEHPQERARDSTRTGARQGFLCSQPKATAMANDAASDVVEQKAHGTTRGHACATMQTLRCARWPSLLARKQKPVICPTKRTSTRTPNQAPCPTTQAEPHQHSEFLLAANRQLRSRAALQTVEQTTCARGLSEPSSSNAD